MARVAFADGLEVKALTHEPQLRAALADPRFARGVQHWKALHEGDVDPAHPMAQMMRIENMLVMDGAEHTRMRSLVAPGFSPTVMRTLGPTVERIVDAQLAVVDNADQPVDLKADFAFPVTAGVLSALLGLDLERMPDVPELIRGSMSGTGEATTDQVRQAIAAVVAHKRQEPDEYIVSTLIAARDENGATLSDSELVDTVMLLVSAGYETTMGALLNITRALLTHAESRAALRRGELTWPQVISEGLRYDGPVNVLSWLFATEDIHYPDGSLIASGEAVLMCYLAANRCPARYGHTAPMFTPEREHSPSLAFGHGPHVCLGRPLARLELETALPRLFERFPDLHLAEAPMLPEASVVMNQPQHLMAHTHASATPHSGVGR